MDDKQFKDLFYEVFSLFVKKPKKIDQLYNDVIKRYSSKGRYYHDIKHIHSMCELWLKHRKDILRPSFVFLAIIYHDIIYKTYRNDNENQSAEYFHNIAFKSNFNMEASEVVYIKDLIRYTQHNCFFELSLHKDAQFLLDIDLYTLSLPENQYRQYSNNIRQEYKRFPNFLYNKGRSEVLKKFLKKEKIFLTREFSIFEENARKNIENEINYLNSPKKRK